MFEAPYPPYDPTDKDGFSYETVVKRWPIIITSVIDRIYNVNHDLTLSNPAALSKFGLDASDKERKETIIQEGKLIIEKVSRLRYRMGRDYELEPVEDDGEPLAASYNTELDALKEKGKGTWFTAPWLYAECYLYRLLRSYFATTIQWREFDPFKEQKDETFRKSGTSILAIATTMREFEETRDIIKNDEEKLRVLFLEMLQMCLWGNATDLSLLTHLSLEDISRLQTVGKEAQQNRSRFILRDDQGPVWEHLKGLKNGTIDFVLDNAGFELFTDLVFADFLVTYTPYVNKVVFHPKAFPWFVSDVIPVDYKHTLSDLGSTFFKGVEGVDENSPGAKDLDVMVERWRQYEADGVFQLSISPETKLGGANGPITFWTSPQPYWNMEVLAKELWEQLGRSDLVIFKGDLNYRKLTGDVRWPASTTLETAFGPLAGSFPILSLRTNKADVVIGLDQAVADRLDREEKRWRIDGKYALISFLPKQA